MLISQLAPTSVKISEHSDQYCGFEPISPIGNFDDYAPIATMIKDCLFFTMGGMLCVIRVPHKTYAYQILWQDMSYFANYGENECARHKKNLGLVGWFFFVWLVLFGITFWHNYKLVGLHVYIFVFFEQCPTLFIFFTMLKNNYLYYLIRYIYMYSTI